MRSTSNLVRVAGVGSAMELLQIMRVSASAKGPKGSPTLYAQINAGIVKGLVEAIGKNCPEVRPQAPFSRGVTAAF